MNFSNEEYNIPGYVDATNFKFIDFDNKFLAGIVIKKLPNMFNFLDVIKAIPKNEIYDLAIYISKKDSSKVLKEISYYISSSSSEQKTVNKNQVDIDILSKVKEDAKELRRAIQIDGEDIFYINILFTFVCTDKFELLRCVKDFRGKLYSKGIISNVLNFRHLDAYKLTLPLGYVENKILDKTYMNVTTSLLSYIFPFYKTNIFDEDGVIFGYTIDDNKICNINIFDNKYINSNVCIFGSSGSGKSYFTKINIIRNYLNGISQYVFDIEGEYINIAKNLKINYLSIYGDLPYFYNIFEIYDYELNYKNSFKNKVDEITKFINKLCKIDKQDLLDELKNSILKMYYEFNIINSNYILNDAIKYKSKDFPTLKDLLKFLKSKKLKNLIQNNILNKFYFLTSHTNIDLSNRLFIVNVNNIT